MSGELDLALAGRLMRLVDARLRLADEGHHPVRSMVLDMREVAALASRGLRVLPHLQHATGRRRIALRLVGAAGLQGLSAPQRSLVDDVGDSPDLRTALAVLPGAGADATVTAVSSA